MSRKIKYIIAIILLISLVIINIPIKRSFDEIALKYYNDGKFNEIQIYKFSPDNWGVGIEENPMLIDELLDYMDNLSYVKIPKYKVDKSDDIYYEIRLQDYSNQDVLKIDIDSNTQIKVWLRYLIKERDEAKNAVSYIVNDKRVNYEVYQGNIDMNYIEEIFQSLEKIK